MAINFPVVYLISAIIISSIINIYMWRNSQTRGKKSFVIASTTSILWMLGDVIGRSTDNFTGQWIGEIVRYLGGSFLPAALFVFVNQYCGKEISGKQLKLLLIIPIISWLVMITNPSHYLFFRSMKIGIQNSLKVEYGLYFWTIHLPYCYAMIMISVAMVLKEFSRASRDYRKQIFFLLISLLIPFIVNVIGVFKLLGEFSYTSLSIPIFFLLMTFAMVRYKFLGSNPIAYETVFNTIRDGVLILDQKDVICDINPAAAKGLGKKPSEIIGFHVRDAFSPWQTAIDLYDAKPVELGEIEVFLYGSKRYLSIESTPLATNHKISEGRIITIRDITDRHKHQLSLEMLAFHDPLTRLANRLKFQKEVEHKIKQMNEKSDFFTILYVDLNRFKEVNDTLGHETGDELLKYVAARLASILRKPDMLARLGGDEFALLLHNCDEENVELVVKRLIESVQRPFKVGENILIADLSIGAAFYPKDGKNLTELLRHADTAMYQAKQNGGGLALHHLNLDSPSDLTM